MHAWILPVLLVGLVATGCGSSSSKAATTISKKETTTTLSKLSGNVTVSAAASLTEAFGKIGADFHTANPNATITFNVGSSGALELQIESGAPADTFASADQANMTKLQAKNLVDPPVVFARNRLVIVTKPGNPKQVKTLADLANVGVVSLCGLTVPCGKYAAQILQTAGVTIPETKVTRGIDVKGTLQAVASGDADAAIVYVTDAKSAGAMVATVTIPAAQNAIAVYPIATVKASGNAAVSDAFITYVTSAKGQATLRSFGFLPAS
ncbi:MAG: molybdenum transporter, periplasmic molybdate-binding protein [Actinomycetia bacterium]|nr:molybdenum transporter, periplasmic molybdate-binding protein [Actinomycetes bacterium]